MRKIKFIEDFANKVKGDEFECDGMLASTLVRDDKVAEFIDIETESEQPKPKGKKASSKESSE